jgi:hypothetical protein
MKIELQNRKQRTFNKMIKNFQDNILLNFMAEKTIPSEAIHFYRRTTTTNTLKMPLVNRKAFTSAWLIPKIKVLLE